MYIGLGLCFLVLEICFCPGAEFNEFEGVAELLTTSLNLNHQFKSFLQIFNFKLVQILTDKKVFRDVA